MRIISKSTIKDYWKKHRETENQLKAWYHIARNAKWKKPGDIKKQLAKTSIINSTRVVFDICGGNYRLIVKINYEAQIIFIRFIGTHKEYDKINVEEI